MFGISFDRKRSLRSLGANWSPSTTGSVVDLCTNIAQGDDYNNRFGSKIRVQRIIIRGCYAPGSTAGATSALRMSIFSLASGAVFTANMTSSYSPTVTGTSLRLWYDRFLSVPATVATMGFPGNIHVSKKVNHFQKFSGTGASTCTGDSIYLIIQANVAAGTGAPTLIGEVEVWFDPM